MTTSNIRLVIATHEQHALAVSLLRETDEDQGRIESAIEDAANMVYLAYINTAAPTDQVVGAAVLCWQADESEILYIAVAPPERGKGVGRAMLAAIEDEAQKRGVRALVVGTANSSVENIAFYQKCGYRMDNVRRDYFNYFAAPVYENGIRIQDMLVFRRVMIAE